MVRWKWITLVGLWAVLGICCQVMPFAGPLVTCDAKPEVSSESLTGYTAAEMERAGLFNAPLPTGLLARQLTSLAAMALFTLAFVRNGREGATPGRLSRWARATVLITAIYLVAYVSGLPYRLMVFLHYQAFGMTPMGWPGWVRLQAGRVIVGLALFLVQWLLVYAAMHVWKRWALPAALLVVVCCGLVPELMPNRPLHPEWKLSPLPVGAVRAALDEVATRAGTRLDYRVVDQSARENSVNMYLCGHAADRYVVLADTFIAAFSPRECAAALAHELGHAAYGLPFLSMRLGLRLLVLVTGFAASFWCLRLIGPAGRRTGYLPQLCAAIVCVAAVGWIARPIGAVLSRMEERRADLYAVSLSNDRGALVSVLLDGACHNLSPLRVPLWQTFLFGHHPGVIERVRQVAGEDPNRSGEMY